MMNIVALSLIATSLVTAGVWSSSERGENIVVKEGHRVVVLEYDREGQPISKISITPESEQRFNSETRGAEAEVKGLQRGPKELICDAYGKCVHKIAAAVGRTKETVEEAKESVRHAEEAASVAAKDARDLGKTILVDVVKNVTGFLSSVRREVAAKAGIAARMVSPSALNPISGTAYVLAFSTAFGTMVWVTFVLSHVLASALPRHQFALVQSKVFRVYFRALALSLALSVFWLVMIHRGATFVRLAEKFQVYNLLASLLLVLVNALLLEPRATKVMYEKMKVEKEEGRGREEQKATPESEPSMAGASEMPENEAARNRLLTLNGRLKKLNNCSSFLNILSLMSLSWHAYYLGKRLHLTF